MECCLNLKVISYRLLILGILGPALSLSAVLSDPSDFEIQFIPWGGRCRISGEGEYLMPSETCDETKGIICQMYQQGNYCGCPILSKFLSYDRASQECRRKPGEFCTYVNATAQPHYYSRLPRHTKCHEHAECYMTLITREEVMSPPVEKKEPRCVCSLGYVVSRDGLECLSVNRSVSSFRNAGTGSFLQNTLLLNVFFLLVKTYH